MPADRRAYFANWKRNKRMELKKQGICPVCSVRKIAKGYASCEPCLVLDRTNKRRIRKNDIA